MFRTDEPCKLAGGHRGSSLCQVGPRGSLASFYFSVASKYTDKSFSLCCHQRPRPQSSVACCPAEGLDGWVGRAHWQYWGFSTAIIAVSR